MNTHDNGIIIYYNIFVFNLGLQNLDGKSTSALMLGLGGPKISSSIRKKDDYDSGDDDSENMDLPGPQRFVYTPKLKSEHQPVFVFSYNCNDASDEHDCIGVSISLPVGYQELTYCVTNGGQALEFRYQWPRMITDENTIFPDLQGDKNSPARVGLRQAIKNLGSGDQLTSVVAQLPFLVDINDIRHRLTGDCNTTLIMTLRKQGAEGLKHSIGKV